MTILRTENLCHWFGDKQVLSDINLDINAGEFVSLVGPSGCGKSTLFRAILGTHPPSSGKVLIYDKVNVRPNRNVGIVYQHYSLFDFLTAEQNIAFGLMLDQTSIPERLFRPFHCHQLKKTYLAKAIEWLNKLDLERAIGCYPTELSGGMRQRVAIAQALVMEPAILLLDEPFGALDESTREDLQKMLLKFYSINQEAKMKGEQPPYTVVMVTHELNEAFYIADRVIGLSQYWEQGGKQGAKILYDKPAPTYTPDCPRDFDRFQQQKEELKKIVFGE